MTIRSEVPTREHGLQFIDRGIELLDQGPEFIVIDHRHLTLCAAARGTSVRPRRGELPLLVMSFDLTSSLPHIKNKQGNLSGIVINTCFPMIWMDITWLKYNCRCYKAHKSQNQINKGSNDQSSHKQNFHPPWT